MVHSLYIPFLGCTLHHLQVTALLLISTSSSEVKNIQKRTFQFKYPREMMFLLADLLVSCCNCAELTHKKQQNSKLQFHWPMSCKSRKKKFVLEYLNWKVLFCKFFTSLLEVEMSQRPAVTCKWCKVQPRKGIYRL